MKFPLSERPFQRVELSSQQTSDYAALTQAIVDATLYERERFIHFDSRVMSKKSWKSVKNREDVTVYKRIGRDRASTSRQQPAESSPWRMPKMVAVGTIAGSLDDIMYGVVTPDAPTIAVKTAYVNDELLDSAVLHQIEGATAADPYQFLGLKWMVKGHAATLNAVVWPRDFVFVESTGLRTLPGGDRVGFHAMHSVDVAACPSLEARGIIRSRLSSCCVYRQLNDGVVELYMMTFADPGGNAPETIAVMSAANTMIGIWKSVWCAQNKKLSWLLENDSARRRFMRSSRRSIDRFSDTSCCTLCSRSFRSFRTVTNCELCAAKVCSRCRIARKLSACSESLELSQRVVEVCKGCVAGVAVADAFEIACAQYVAVEPRPAVKSIGDTRPRESSGTLPGSLTSLGDFSRVQSWREDELDVDARAREESEPEPVLLETAEDWERESKRYTQSGYRQSTIDDDSAPRDHQQQMLLQMQSLCLAAEQTYQITSFHASRMLDASNQGDD